MKKKVTELQVCMEFMKDKTYPGMRKQSNQGMQQCQIVRIDINTDADFSIYQTQIS